MNTLFSLSHRFSSLCISKSHFRITPLLSSSHPSSSLLVVQKRNYLAKDPNDIALHRLAPNRGTTKDKIRVGRGSGSKIGKTCGRGVSGQKSRASNSSPSQGFEGGQLPLYKRMRKFGFKNRTRRDLTELNIKTLVEMILAGRIDPYQPINVKHIYDSGCIHRRIKHGIKLLSRGKEDLTKLNMPLELHVSEASEEAANAIEEAGGSVKLLYYNRLSLRYMLEPEKFFFKPTFARPPPKRWRIYSSHPEPTPISVKAGGVKEIPLNLVAHQLPVEVKKVEKEKEKPKEEDQGKKEKKEKKDKKQQKKQTA